MTENEIQRAVFSHLRKRPSPGVFAFHPKNGSRDMRGRGAGIYTGLGVEPGIPDVIIFKGYSQAIAPTVYAMELKTEERRNRKPTRHELDQETCRTRMSGCGVITTVCYGLDEALNWLEGCGLLKGAAQTQRRSENVG